MEIPSHMEIWLILSHMEIFRDIYVIVHGQDQYSVFSLGSSLFLGRSFELCCETLRRRYSLTLRQALSEISLDSFLWERFTKIYYYD